MGQAVLLGRRATVRAVGLGLVLLPCLPSFMQSALATSLRPAERAWADRSAMLARAAKAHAELGEFRKDILEHREKLRAIISANRKAPPELMHLHRSMVLTSALLSAASECHVGGRVVCPPELMHQIETQVRLDRDRIAALESAAQPAKRSRT